MKPVTIYCDNREIIAFNEHKNWSFKIETVGQFIMLSKFILDCKYEIWNETLFHLLNLNFCPIHISGSKTNILYLKAIDNWKSQTKG